MDREVDIHRVPVEILGRIFVWSLARDANYLQHYHSHFDGFQKGSYNFLLVCHRWFEVAAQTPELWSFWGNTLQDWKKWHHRSGAIPLDLVLDGDKSDPMVSFDGTLQDAVRSRVAQDNIRQVHLKSGSPTLAPIILSLIPDNESAQNENIESIIWRSERPPNPPVDVSTFFARSRLTKLHSLKLSGNISISSWDRLASRTTLLTTLSLKIGTPQPSPTPTASQLLSILASNPNLQRLTLAAAVLPNDIEGSTFKVPLPNLKRLSLTAEFRHIFGLLRQLILPEVLDSMKLTMFDSTMEDVSQILGPYMRGYFRRDARFQDDVLEVSASSYFPASISVSTVAICSEVPSLNPPLVMFKVVLVGRPPRDVLEELFVNLIAPIPKQDLVYFRADLDGTSIPEEVLLMMPKIETLSLAGVELSKGFLQPDPDGPHANEELLPSLESLVLEEIFPRGDDWSPLITYLAHQTSKGQLISLEIADSTPLRPEVVDEIEGLVEDFSLNQ